MIAGLDKDSGVLSIDEIAGVLSRGLERMPVAGRRVLVIIPDSTRTAPMGLLFRGIVDQVGRRVKKLDFLVALGTHPPMSDEQINAHLELTADERTTTYAHVGVFNHRWDLPDQLTRVGSITGDEVAALTGGMMNDEIPVVLNKMVLDYDVAIVCGPVFPHEVVGFSGGNKYFFPGIAAEDIIHQSHWLGALITNPRTNGNKRTPVRAMIDRAAGFLKMEKFCLAFVVEGRDLAGLYVDRPEEAWSAAADLAAKRHIRYESRPYNTVLSQAPRMYDDIWTAGKCMYKLEPIVADGGELIIYAPHVTEFSYTHGKLLDRIGYHVRDYFLNRWSEFRDVPKAVLAHSSHVRGIGTCTDGREEPRIQVTLATGISPERCARANLGYRDLTSIRIEEFQNRENEGILHVPGAGEILYRLADPPEWQREWTAHGVDRRSAPAEP